MVPSSPNTAVLQVIIAQCNVLVSKLLCKAGRGNFRRSYFVVSRNKSVSSHSPSIALFRACSRIPRCVLKAESSLFGLFARTSLAGGRPAKQSAYLVVAQSTARAYEARGGLHPPQHRSARIREEGGRAGLPRLAQRAERRRGLRWSARMTKQRHTMPHPLDR